jgi:predicted metal-dependent hydrolase
MATKQITIPEIGDVTLYKRRGNRSMRLSIGLNGEVRVSLPYWLPYAAGAEFARTKASWIAANRGSTKALQHGEAIGKAHRLYFEPRAAIQKVSSRVTHTEIRISHPSSHHFADQAVQKIAHKASVKALYKEAETLLPQRLRTLAEQQGFTYKSVSVKQLKSRWGSCNSEQEITLNVFLMQLPWHLIDYVLLHELTHTRIMQHGTPFWEELERHLPNAKSLRKQISAHQPILAPRTA